MRILTTASVFVVLTLIFVVSGGENDEGSLGAPEVLLEKDEIVIDAGNRLNLTCRDRHPVAWSTSSTHSYVVEVTDDGHEKPFVTSLLIDSVDYKDVGYFFCFRNTTENRNRESLDPDEPLVSPVYVYVKDEKHLIAKVNRVHDAFVNKNFTLPCRPTFPEVKMTLDDVEEKVFDPREGFTFIATWNHYDLFCEASYNGTHDNKEIIMTIIPENWKLPKPEVKVDGEARRNFLKVDEEHYTVKENSTVRLICTYNKKSRHDPSVYLKWEAPDYANKDKHHRETTFYKFPTLTKTYEILNAVPSQSGEYKCSVCRRNHLPDPTKIMVNVIGQDAVKVSLRAENSSIEASSGTQSVSWSVTYHAFPEPVFLWRKNDKVIVDSSQPNEGDRRCKFDPIEDADKYILTIHKPTVMDNGQYSLEAIIYSEDGQILGNDTVLLNLSINASPYDMKTYLIKGKPMYAEKERFQLVCEVTGYPKPDMELLVKRCFGSNNCTDYSSLSDMENDPNDLKQTPADNKTQVMEKKTWYGQARAPGFFKCKARNVGGENESEEIAFLVTDGTALETLTAEVEVDGVIDDSEVTEVYEQDKVVLRCRENKMGGFRYPTLIGYPEDVFRNTKTKEKESSLSYISEVSPLVTLQHGNWVNFSCQHSDDPGLKGSREVRVKELVPPTWKEGKVPPQHIRIKELMNLTMSCEANGDPTPVVTWYQGDVEFAKGPKISFQLTQTSHSGLYICEASNRADTLTRIINVEVFDPDAETIFIISIVGPLLIALLIITVIAIYCIKVYSDWNRVKILRLEDHRMFVRGDPERINPELGLDQQAELLPYDTKFEIPREAIIFDKILGSGAFGRVYKATVENILPGQAQTTVAVKMSKSRNDAALLKVLRSEVKIMIHIGRHVNIVNLLGACSKELATKGELLLLVEYCQHGNILDYMRRHKNNFVNQINGQDKIDPAFKAHKRQESDSGSSMKNPQGLGYAQLSFNTGDASDSAGTSSDEGSAAQALWASLEAGSPEDATRETRNQTTSNGSSTSGVTTYTYDNSNGGSGGSMIAQGAGDNPKALCSKVLLCWAFQIAKGMEYLAFRKVLHGDLAARNILLAEDNIVKISDFGLARDIYKNDNYRKKTNGPMPVKWMALECFREGVFSTQSDVWSYGIVLWEIFTLGQEPYPGVEFDESFIQKLERGKRMEQPKFATYEIYRIMMACWNADPRSRPSFTILEETLGNMLGEAEKQQCLDLNDPYQADNEPSEYLSQVQSVDYSSIVRRSVPDFEEDVNETPVNYSSIERRSIPDFEDVNEMPVSPGPSVPMIIVSSEDGSRSHDYVNVQEYNSLDQEKMSEDSVSSPTKASQEMLDIINETANYNVKKDNQGFQALALQEDSEDEEDTKVKRGHGNTFSVTGNDELRTPIQSNGVADSSTESLHHKMAQQTSEMKEDETDLNTSSAYSHNDTNYIRLKSVSSTDENNLNGFITEEDSCASEKNMKQLPNYINLDEMTMESNAEQLEHYCV